MSTYLTNMVDAARKAFYFAPPEHQSSDEHWHKVVQSVLDELPPPVNIAGRLTMDHIESLRKYVVRLVNDAANHRHVDSCQADLTKAFDGLFECIQEPLEGAQLQIATVCNELREMLLEKNRAYGNSALDPVRIFSKAEADEQIKVRIDDKLSRLARGSAAGEDVVLDLLGYLVLLRVSQRAL